MLRVATALTVLAGFTAAQTIVIPNGAATAEGGSAGLFPWGRGPESVRQQFIYDSSNFTAQGVTTPILITRLRWRPDVGYVSATESWGACSYGRANVQLSTCPLDQAVASTTFANNRGDDLTTVYSGPVNIAAGTATVPGPAPFVVDITLTTPFVYNPAAGDLNIETDLPAGMFSGSPGMLLDIKHNGVSCMVVAASDSSPTGSFTPGFGQVVEVSYVPTAGMAFTSQFGRGCNQATAPGDFGSFYEFFTNAGTFDLSNTAMTMTPNGSGYVVAASATALRPPSAAATVLPLTHDSLTTVTLASPFPFAGGVTSQLEVGSDGFVSAAPGNGLLNGPLAPLSPGAMLAAPVTAWYIWHDFDPTAPGSGQIKFEEVGSLSILTWDGVHGSQFNSFPSTFQFQFDRATGAVHYVFGTVTLISIYSAPALVGYSPGGPSGDPGNRDLSATLAAGFTLPAADVAPLTHTATGRPRLGTSIALLTTEMPASSLLGAGVLSLTRMNPGIDLTAVGMPGCRRYLGLDVITVFVPAVGTGSLPLAIPANAAFAGLDVVSQSVAFAPGANAAGLLSSNGLLLHLGVN